MAPRQKQTSGSTPSSGSEPSSGSTPSPGRAKTTAGPTRHLEIETKLEIDQAATLPELAGSKSLRAVGLHGVADPVVHELDAVYFDTSELDLLRSRLTLRHRTGGDDAGWHLKLPAIAGARTEIGLPLGAGSSDPLTAHVPAALAELVLGAARGRPLRPVARIRNRRTVRRLLDASGEPMVEVADDQVSSTRLVESSTAATGFDESSPTRWRELEVEILAGDRAQLGAVVMVLQASGATAASSVSKLARALADPLVGAPGKSAAAPRKHKTAGPAVMALMSRLRDRLITADRALRDSGSDALHDARACARRIRSVLEVFAPLFAAGETRYLRAELRHFGAVLGRARDLEILHDRLAGQLDDEPIEYATAAARQIDAEMARVVPVALAEVAELLRSQRYLEMLRALDSFVADPPVSRRAAKGASSEMAGMLSASWRKLGELAGGALAEPLDNPVFHKVRIAARALRYAAEAAAATLGEETVVFAAAIEEIQEVLGEHQDALTSAVWLAELAMRPETDGVSGFVFGRLHAFEQAVAHGTVDDSSDAWDRVKDGALLEAVTRR